MPAQQLVDPAQRNPHRKTTITATASTAPLQNPRQQAAKHFAVAAANRGESNLAHFKRGLKGYLDARDIAYPNEAHLPVNRAQCIAIFLAARPRQRTHKAS